MSLYVYVVQYGDALKVGQTSRLEERYADYQRDARRDGVRFVPLFVTPAHLEADENERAVLAEFRPAGQRTEYLTDVDPDEVIGFIQQLPQTPPPPRGEVTEWITRDEASARTGWSTERISRYIRGGHLRARKNEITKRVRVAANDLEAIQ